MSPEIEGRPATAAHGRVAVGLRSRGTGPSRGRARSLAALLALVGMTAGLAACGPQPKGSYPEDDPRSAVYQLLRATIGQANGQRACALLTEAAREQFDRTPAGSCRNALNTAVAAFPGTDAGANGMDREAEDIELESRVDGDRATVTASRGDGHRLSFEVVRLSETELAADLGSSDRGVGSAPKSDWRVVRGAEQLVKVSRGAAVSSDPDGTTERDGDPVPDARP